MRNVSPGSPALRPSKRSHGPASAFAAAPTHGVRANGWFREPPVAQRLPAQQPLLSPPQQVAVLPLPPVPVAADAAKTGSEDNGQPRLAPTPAISVLIASDCQLMLWGLEKLIHAEKPRMEVVARACSNADLLTLAETCRPDVTLLELDGETNADFLPELLSRTQGRVLVLARACDGQLLERAVRNGAHGILRKEEPVETIVKVTCSPPAIPT